MIETNSLKEKVISKNLVDLSLNASTKEDAIYQLSNLIFRDGRVSNYDEYVKSVLEREETFSTGIGMGVAIPHGKCSTVKTSTIAFGKCNNGIDWQSLDEEPVKIVFLLAVPQNNEEDNNEHLKILAALSRKLIHEEFREKITNATEEEIVELISNLL